MTMVLPPSRHYLCVLGYKDIALEQRHGYRMVHISGVELVLSLYRVIHCIIIFRKIDTIAFSESIQSGLFPVR